MCLDTSTGAALIFKTKEIKTMSTATKMNTEQLSPEQEEFFRLRQQCTDDTERLAIDCAFINEVRNEKDRRALVIAYRKFKTVREFKKALRLIRKAQKEREQAGDLTAAGKFNEVAQFIEGNLLAA